MDISVVIPLYNEEESLKELNDWIVHVMQSNHFSFEIIYIDDGSFDDSWKLFVSYQMKVQILRELCSEEIMANRLL